MDWLNAPEYWLSRLILERGIAGVYVLAFVAAAQQFRALIGEHGLLPVPRFLARRSFKQSPSIFYVHYSDRFFATVAWLGAALSAAMACGLADVVPLGVSVMSWLLLWVLYVSIVNVGQTFYAFGWESLLCEVGVLAMFLGDERIRAAGAGCLLGAVAAVPTRVRGRAHQAARRPVLARPDVPVVPPRDAADAEPAQLVVPPPAAGSHRVEVLGNHVAQLVVPFLLFAPQPVAGAAALAIIVTQTWLVLSGNFSWLNFLTITLALQLSRRVGPVPPRSGADGSPAWYDAVVIVVTVLSRR